MTDTNKKRHLEVVATENEEDETCRTFVLHNEDHTLGNALRYMTLKDPEVEFCGYSVPHPSENKINFRIQTKGAPAKDALNNGFIRLGTLCEHILKTFESSVDEFKRNQQIERMEEDFGK